MAALRVQLNPRRELENRSYTMNDVISFEIQRAIVSIRTLNEIYPFISNEEKDQVRRALEQIKVG